MKPRFARVLDDITQCPQLVPDHIPMGSQVEILREVKHKDFYSGKGYVILWHEKCYADVVDVSKLEFL